MAPAMSARCSGAKTKYSVCRKTSSSATLPFPAGLQTVTGWWKSEARTVIIMYGTSQNLQHIFEFVKKGKASNHIFKIELWPSALTFEKQYDFSL